MRLPKGLGGVLFALLACALARGEDAAELELDHEMSMAFETPHTKWAKPYAGGRLRVLLFCDGRGTTPRVGVELKERFDLDVDAVFWAQIVDSTKQGWHGGDLGLKRMLRLVGGGDPPPPYDCYLFFGIPPTNLTSEMQYKVFKPVTEGRGILLVGCGDRRVLKPANRIREIPPFLAGVAGAGLYRVGKGRGVELPRPADIPYDVGWETAYDYWQEQLGRAIFCAAGREPKVDLQALAEQPEVERAALPKGLLAVRWRNPARAELTVEISIRREDGLVVPLDGGPPRAVGGPSLARGEDPRGAETPRLQVPPEGVRVTAPEGELRREAPRLRAGRYHLDAIARSAKGVEAWATAPFTVKSERRVEAVSLECPFGEIGERIIGSVQLAGNPVADERLLVRLRDRRDRILAQAELPAAGGPKFDLPVSPWLPMLVRVEAALCDGSGEVAVAHAYFNVTKRHRGQFNFLVWDVPSGSLAPYAEESLARLGTTLQLRGGTPPPVVAAYDIAWVPYTTRILEGFTPDGVMKPFCWNDEAKVAAHVTELADKYRESRRHGVFVYSLGDENHVRGSCLSPQCLKAYRGYLAKEYGSIEALNASWGSAYKGFDEVALLKPDDNLEAEAKRQGNFPRWFDRQAFRSWNYVQFCRRFAAAYRAIDPKSRTGFEGAGRFTDGDDLDLFVRELEFWSPYPGTADEVLRSIAPRDFPRANWMGYVKEATPLIAKYWRMITRGCDSVWWWRWDCIGRFHGFLAPHLGPWPATQELVDETKIVRDGLGTLLLRSEMQDGGIAMLFSHPSCYAGQLEGSYDGVEQSHLAWQRAIRELGLQFRYVTDRMLRLGEFDAKRFRLLILPRAEAIGPKEAAAIEAFVRGGGAVMADVRPGLYDGHCKPLAEGCLDKLFGIRRTGRGPAAKGKAEIKLEGSEFAFDGAACDPGVEAAGGKAYGRCGERPLMIVNKAGSGQALLLNLAMATYPALDKPATPEAAADLFAELFRIVGAKPAVATRTNGKRTRNLETIRWKNGDLEIVALFRHTGDDEDAQVELAEPRFVYDLRTKKALGQVKSFPTRLIGSRPTWLLLAPRELASVRATLSKAEAAPGERPILRLEVPGAAGLHAVRLRGRIAGNPPPDGRPADWLDQVVIVGAEPTEVTLPIAFNDPEGKWEIRAIDLFTGQAAAATLVVKEKAQ